MLKIPSIILMSSDMPREAITLMQEYGSEIVFYNERMEKKDKILDELIGKFGWTLMPSYDYRESVIGYATLIKELIDEVGPLDYLFASVGSGGLISACAIAASYYSPECLVVGVKCGDQNFGSLSCTSGLMSYAPYPMADEGWVHTIGHPTLSIVRSYVRDVVMVAEEAAHAQMRFFAERMKILVEPMGSLAAAAVLNKIVDVSGKRVGVIVSGGNVPLHAFSGILRKI
jgi:threonine dehydratase